MGRKGPGEGKRGARVNGDGTEEVTHVMETGLASLLLGYYYIDE